MPIHGEWMPIPRRPSPDPRNRPEYGTEAAQRLMNFGLMLIVDFRPNGVIAQFVEDGRGQRHIIAELRVLDHIKRHVDLKAIHAAI